MYEDNMLPVYVDYIGNIMPILDRQSISTNWPPMPHPIMGHIRYVPYNSANMPTVPYMLSVDPQFLPQPIRGALALSEVASGTQPGIQGDSVSQIGVSTTPAVTMPATSYVTFPLSTQSVLPATPAYEPIQLADGTSVSKGEQKIVGKPSLMVNDLPLTEMEQTVPCID